MMSLHLLDDKKENNIEKEDIVEALEETKENHE